MTERFLDAFEFVLAREGGYVNDVFDPGGKTKYGISQRSYPELDIANLTAGDARDIYWRDYWLACGCEDMRWPLSLMVFDAAVNSGNQFALMLLTHTQDPEEYLARRIDRVSTFRQWERYGRGWTRRLAKLLQAASGEDAEAELDTLVLHLPFVEPIVFRGPAIARQRATESGMKQDVRFVGFPPREE